MGKREILPIHPGEILLEEFLMPMEISQYRLSKDISVDPRRVNEIVHGQRAISADPALRFGRYFGTSPREQLAQRFVKIKARRKSSMLMPYQSFETNHFLLC